MVKNQGLKIEKQFKKFLKGQKSLHDCYDFHTSKCCYEVKSCKLFVKCYNSNHKRDFKNKPHKKCETTQQGKFRVYGENHYLLKEWADKLGKEAKYLLVIRVGNQRIWKIVPWSYIHVKNEPKWFSIRINNYFWK